MTQMASVPPVLTERISVEHRLLRQSAIRNMAILLLAAMKVMTRGG